MSDKDEKKHINDSIKKHQLDRFWCVHDPKKGDKLKDICYKGSFEDIAEHFMKNDYKNTDYL